MSISGGKPLLINGECVERVSDFRFLGSWASRSRRTWSANTTGTIKEAQQRLYFLRLLRKNHLSQKLLVSFYHCSIESVLTYCLCVRYTSCTRAEKKALQRVINTAQRIIGCPLPSLDELYGARCLKKAQNILRDLSHPGHGLLKCCPRAKDNKMQDKQA